MNDPPTRPRRPRPPWWPKEASWYGQPGEGRRPVPAEPEAVPALPPPPPAPPFINRAAGMVLLAATLGLASCQAFIAAVSQGSP